MRDSSSNGFYFICNTRVTGHEGNRWGSWAVGGLRKTEIKNGHLESRRGVGRHLHCRFAVCNHESMVIMFLTV